MTRLPIANGRSVEEWRGDTPDTAIPDRVRVRVFDRLRGCCHSCARVIRAGEKWTCEHLIALINWRATKEYPHGNVESNLGITCEWCLPIKNAADVAEKSHVYETRRAHLGLKQPKRPMPGSRASKWKKKMNRQVELRR